MNRLTIIQPRSLTQASQLLLDRRYDMPMLKAGGMDVLDHLKEGLLEPDALIDIKRLGNDARGERIFLADGIDQPTTLHIEAGTTLSQIAGSGLVRKHAPVIAQAVESAATPQVRNVATAAGNLLQRPRCWYYRNQQFDCLKKGGHTCYAVEGENRYHAILGGGPCHIVHPSNLAPALHICDGQVHLIGSKRHSLPVSDLFHGPQHGITTEHVLEPGEIISHITCTARPASAFYAVKEKQSFDWPLVMAAAAVEIDNGTVRWARVCAGAVAPTPWPLPQVDAALVGIRIDDEAALRKACALSIEGAVPMTDNAYKLTLLPVAVMRAVMRAAGRLIAGPGGIDA